MAENASPAAAVKKPAQFKPPVPARPKNLVVLNSRTLPKPPENVLTGTVINCMKTLNIENKEGEKTSQGPIEKNHSLERKVVTPHSDEEDIDGYLEPVSFPLFGSIATSSGKCYYRPSTAGQNPISDGYVKSATGENHGNKSSQNTKEKDRSSEGDAGKQPILHSLRPLPLPPVKKESEVTSMPWFKNVDRKKGEELLKDGADGCFLVRPSSKEDTYLTLTLWFHNRLYNIPIRKRRDGKYALGTPKTNEQCFDSVEEMVTNYQSEKLLLYSNGTKAGRTLLTTYPT